MSHLNVEIKARCDRGDAVRDVLRSRGADFRGVDHQVDTYFHVPVGRLKLREGNIETRLIHYAREDKPGPKEAMVTLYRPERPAELKEILTAVFGVRVVVAKRREIYFIDNVKFHIDTVEGLGHFVEIEAIDADGSIGRSELLQQCRKHIKALRIRHQDLVDCSYSDMLPASR